MKHIALAALLALTACKNTVTSDLFTSDLIAATQGEALTAPIVIGMESSSSDCAEKGPQMLNAISQSMNDVEFIGCERVEYDTYARFRAQAEILDQSQTAQPTSALAIGVAQDGQKYTISYLVNPSAVRAIWDALPEDMTKYQNFAFQPTLSAVLNNDLRTPVTVTLDDVFADGRPIQGTQFGKLPRRDQVELSMSNVTNAAFGTTENASIVVVFEVPE